jgi:hypothetical protein
MQPTPFWAAFPLRSFKVERDGGQCMSVVQTDNDCRRQSQTSQAEDLD